MLDIPLGGYIEQNSIIFVETPVFKLGLLNFYLYGLLVGLGIVAGYHLIKRRLTKYPGNEKDFNSLFLFISLTSLVGARLYHILDFRLYYLSHPLEVFHLTSGGLAIYGAIAGALGGLGFALWKWGKLSLFFRWTDILAPGALLAQAVGRWGNYINQESFGPPTNLPWAVYINQSYFHPLFLYESLWNLLGCFILLKKIYNHKKPGASLGFYLLWYGVGRFFIEFLRSDTAIIFGVKVAQALSLVAIVTGIYLILRRSPKVGPSYERKTRLLFLILIFTITFTFTIKSGVQAIYDPLSAPNNKVGIHILEPSEIESAAEIVNGNGGDWGYVTVPIQSTDRDRLKWQKFMDSARSHHITPIIRLATCVLGDTWIKPTQDDILDFSNFLDALNWPTYNRYVIVFNEPNHAKEWGGEVSPEEYSKILRFAVEVFKNKSDNFFLLPAALDLAAPNSPVTMSSRLYTKRMIWSDPQVFKLIDGWASHSYPNPDFSGRPEDRSRLSIIGYRYELTDIRQIIGNKYLPVFITETGWQHQNIAPTTVAEFLKKAYTFVWTDTDIVAVTPFVLSAYDGPFKMFSFLEKGAPTPESKALKELPKTRGAPTLVESRSNTEEKPESTSTVNQAPILPLLDKIKQFFGQ
jgi:phosphatidylglycerol:prolipoprotein diacylglycerol transferase